MATFTLAEVAQHKDPKDLWMVIHDKVYDITKFLSEHPGGEEILVENGGDDSTEAFEDVGHSHDAREMLKDYFIGDLHENDKKSKRDENNAGAGSDAVSWKNLIVPVVIVLAAAVVYRVYIAKKN